MSLDLHNYPARIGRISFYEVISIEDLERRAALDDQGFVEQLDEDSADNLRIWKLHVDKYVSKLTVVDWFPQIKEAFLLYVKREFGKI